MICKVDCSADLDVDGQVGTSDLLVLFANWESLIPSDAKGVSTYFGYLINRFEGTQPHVKPKHI